MAAGESAQAFREDDARVELLFLNTRAEIRDVPAETMVNHIHGVVPPLRSLKLRRAVAKLSA
jgi:hypothetical protein